MQTIIQSACTRSIAHVSGFQSVYVVYNIYGAIGTRPFLLPSKGLGIYEASSYQTLLFPHPLR